MTTSCRKRSAGRTPAFCPYRPQVSGARVADGCMELTPSQGASCVSPPLAPPSPPRAPRLGNTFLSSLFPAGPAPTIQKAHLPSPGKTRRGGLARPERPAATGHAPSPGRFPAATRVGAARILGGSASASRAGEEPAHDGGGGERQRPQQRRRGQQQQRHVQHRRGGAHAAPLPDVRWRRGRIH